MKTTAASLTYEIVVTAPSNGTVVVDGAIATYTPHDDYNGEDSFSFRVTDSDGLTSTVAVVAISITAVNDAPVAGDDSATTSEDTAVVIVLTASDTEGDTNLTYTVATAPSNGSVIIAGDQATYTPDSDYNGDDSFSFVATDSGGLASTAAVVAITITAVNDAPVASDGNASTSEDTAVDIALIASDTEDASSSLTYIVTTEPSNGTVAVNGATATYTPSLNFFGDDSFSYRAVDTDSVVSEVATVSISIAGINDAPVASAGSASTNEDTAVAIELIASDTEDASSSLTYTVTTDPSNGTVAVNGAIATYTPNTDANGVDSFSFEVTDSGGLTSTVAVVAITVTAVNDAPVANVGSASTSEDTAVTIALIASDSEDDSSLLSYALVANPSKGTVAVNGAIATYTPNTDANGVDSFSFTVTDSGGLTSTAAVVAITITAINDAPVASAGSASTSEDTAVTIALIASDSEDDSGSLIYTIVTEPSKGTVTISGNQATYTPDSDYNGDDSFSFVATDSGGLTSTAAVVDITITAVNDAPVASDR